ncbi:hypothetical protein E4U43_006580, partial [Claviceps pusilla]
IDVALSASIKEYDEKVKRAIAIAKKSCAKNVLGDMRRDEDDIIGLPAQNVLDDSPVDSAILARSDLSANESLERQMDAFSRQCGQGPRRGLGLGGTLFNRCTQWARTS